MPSISPDLDRLANIARQSKTPEDFASNFAKMRTVLIKEKGKAGIWDGYHPLVGDTNRLYSTSETAEELTNNLKQKGFNSIEDFYKKANGVSVTLKNGNK